MTSLKAITREAYKIICRFNGHARGKKIGSVQLEKVPDTWANKYECPKCGGTWIRKVRAGK